MSDRFEGDSVGHMGDLLSALVDGELEPASAAAAEEHVAVCPSCQAELADTRATRDLVRGLPMLDPPFALVQRVRRRDRRRPLAWVAAGAAAAAVFVLAASPGPERTTPPVAQFVEAHATADVIGDPVSNLSPGALLPVSWTEP
jgi:anti-sigma factor RsiW